MATRGPLNSAEPTTSILISGVYNAQAPAPADEQVCALQLDSEGNLLVNVMEGGGVLGSVKIEDSSGNALNSNGSGALQVAVVSGGGSNPSVGLTGTAAPTSATEIGIIDGSGKLQGASSSNPVPVSGTVSIGSGPFAVAGSLTNNNAAPTTTNVGVLPTVANANPPTWVEGNQVLISEDLQGSTRIRPGAPKTANWSSLAINCSSLGNNVIIVGVGGQTIRVMRMFFVNSSSASSTNVTIEDTGSLIFTGPFLLNSAGSFNGTDANGEPLFVSASGQGIQLNSTAAVQLSGTVWYTQSA